MAHVSRQVDSVVASLHAARTWAGQGMKLALMSALGLGVLPLLAGFLVELAMLPLKCVLGMISCLTCGPSSLSL